MNVEGDIVSNMPDARALGPGHRRPRIEGIPAAGTFEDGLGFPQNSIAVP